MGYAMLKGLLKTYSPDEIVFSCATDKKRVAVSDETGVRAVSGNAECANSAKYIILAVKPQVYDVVIKNILDFSKLEAGKFTLEQREFDFRSMMEYVKANHKNKIAEKGWRKEACNADR